MKNGPGEREKKGLQKEEANAKCKAPIFKEMLVRTEMSRLPAAPGDEASTVLRNT
jgi:hypothetical protein